MQPTFFLNDTSIIGIGFTMLTNNITGSPFISLIIIFLLFLALALGANIPIEWTAIIILPLAIYLMAYSTEFLQILGFILIYLGLLLAKTWIASER